MTYTPSSGRDRPCRPRSSIASSCTSSGTRIICTAAICAHRSACAPLPIGSTLDASTGAFTWAPASASIGRYDLTFVRWSGGHAVARQDVRVTLNAEGQQPRRPADDHRRCRLAAGRFAAGDAFCVGGWAADLDSPDDTASAPCTCGRIRSTRTAPARSDFIGPAIFGGARPDVAAVYGDRFLDSGYGIIVNGLAPGTYDIAVFAYSTVVNNFTAARVARVIVR